MSKYDFQNDRTLNEVADHAVALCYQARYLITKLHQDNPELASDSLERCKTLFAAHAAANHNQSENSRNPNGTRGRGNRKQPNFGPESPSQFILDILLDSSEDQDVSSLLELMLEAEYETNKNALIVTLHRLKQDNYIVSPRRGRYRITDEYRRMYADQSNA